jgi:hypothetical protein
VGTHLNFWKIPKMDPRIETEYLNPSSDFEHEMTLTVEVWDSEAYANKC